MFIVIMFLDHYESMQFEKPAVMYCVRVIPKLSITCVPLKLRTLLHNDSLPSFSVPYPDQLTDCSDDSVEVDDDDDEEDDKQPGRRWRKMALGISRLNKKNGI